MILIKKYYNDVNGYTELILKLPKLNGNYNGIPEINKFLASKEEFFYKELYLLPNGLLKEGEKDNFYRSANYKLEVQFKNIISISADLDDGAGGVGWDGIEGDTFNLDSSKKLELSDIFKTNKDEYMNFIFDFVSKKIMNDINLKAYVGYMFDDAYSGDGYKSIRAFDPNDFYLSKDGLVIFYQKYALAAEVAGVIKFVIPYESISNILSIDVKNYIKIKFSVKLQLATFMNVLIFEQVVLFGKSVHNNFINITYKRRMKVSLILPRFSINLQSLFLHMVIIFLNNIKIKAFIEIFM